MTKVVPGTACDDWSEAPEAIASSGARAERPVRVVIATENCSLRMAGEAALPYHYFRLLLARGVEVRLITQERNREELEAAFPDHRDRLHFIPDDAIQRGLWYFNNWLPNRAFRATFGFVASMHLQAQQQKLIRDIVRKHSIDVIHQPYPVAPSEPSMIYDVGAPVVIGPMNGGMNYPPGMWQRENWFELIAVRLGRRLRHVLNWLIPGKRDARILLFANARSRQLIPKKVRGEVLELVENSVDLSRWRPSEERRQPGGAVRFVYLGRLVGWKGVDLLIHAWASIEPPPSGELELIGDGPMRRRLEELCQRLGVEHSVKFVGYQPSDECARRLAQADVLVLPSLIECGGAVVLEAMATGLPVIATDWGGPADYIDPSCGILVPPTSREAFVHGLAQAIARLDRSPELRQQMGATALRKAHIFSWEAKIDRILEIYQRASHDGKRVSPSSPRPRESETVLPDREVR